jgi:hypothetical protein
MSRAGQTAALMGKQRICLSPNLIAREVFACEMLGERIL